MAIYGYVLNLDSNETQNSIKTMMSYDCDRIITDTIDSYPECPMWKNIMKNIKNGDTLMIHSFSNVIKGMNALSLLFELCLKNNIRLISLEDRFDSAEKMFKKKSNHEWMEILSDLPMHLKKKEMTIRENSTRYSKHEVAPLTPKQKDALVLNLYKQGVTTPDIMRRVGYTTRASVYRVLKRYNVEPNRIKK